MNKKALLGCFVFFTLAFTQSAQARVQTEAPCRIFFDTVSGVGIFANNGEPINSARKGRFIVMAKEVPSVIYAYPREGRSSPHHVYGKDYVWMIDDKEVVNFGDPIELGRIAGTDTLEFKVYPKAIPELLPAGKFDASLDLEVQCHGLQR